MQIRKIEAKDMREALAMVKKELGPDAVIITARQVNGRGLFARPHVEVTAAIDDVPDASDDFQHATNLRASNDRLESSLAPLRREIQALRGELRVTPALSNHSTLDEQTEEVRRLARDLPLHSDSDDSLAEILSTADVQTEIAQEMLEAIRARQTVRPGEDVARAEPTQALVDVIAERLGVPFQRVSKDRTVMALVGPTGVGKTTSIAKLAARMALIRKMRVGLITLDTYRIGAIEQLEHYANLIDVPLHVARNEESFKKALDELTHCQVVLVDTAGRGPSSVGQIDALARILVPNKVQVHLVVPVGTRQLDLRNILARYETLEPKSLLFTKLDETTAFGALVNATSRAELPLSYVTFGQRVPEDIALANPRSLARLLVDGARGFDDLEAHSSVLHTDAAEVSPEEVLPCR